MGEPGGQVLKGPLSKAWTNQRVLRPRPGGWTISSGTIIRMLSRPTTLHSSAIRDRGRLKWALAIRMATEISGADRQVVSRKAKTAARKPHGRWSSKPSDPARMAKPTTPRASSAARTRAASQKREPALKVRARRSSPISRLLLVSISGA